MADTTSKVFFYNSRDGDRKYDADSMTEWLRPFFTTGVFNGGLQVTANGNLTVTVQPGHVNIGGKVTRFEAPKTLDLEVASGTLNRIDNIIVRRDDVARDIYLMVQTGGLAAKPIPPPLVRENGLYDLKLAEVEVTNGTISVTQANITDTRMIKAVCGWVTATVTEMDFSQIQAQFNAFFAEYKPRIQNAYHTYVQDILAYKAKFEDDTLAQYDDFESFVDLYKQHSTEHYDALLDWFDQFKVDVGAWLDLLKSTLTGDQAVNLFEKIDQHEKQSVKNPSGVHDVHFDGRFLTVDVGYGRAIVGRAEVGQTWSCIESFGYTWDEFNRLKLTWEKFENLLEVV